MTPISILCTTERSKFDSPPTLKKEERSLYFAVTPEIRRSIAGIDLPENRVGFLLQWGYFKATGRFFTADKFKQRDLTYVAKLLGHHDSNKLSNYSNTVVYRHRQKILSILGWLPYNEEAKQALILQADQLAPHQIKPQQTLALMVDYCWKHRIEIPSYDEFSILISSSYNQVESRLVALLDDLLESDHKKRLEALLMKSEEKDKRSLVALTELRKINQSLKLASIKENVQASTLFREHFLEFEPVYKTLALSDRATEYYATWVYKADNQQLQQFKQRSKAFLYLLAFIRHQFFLRQDTLADILLKWTASALHAANKKITEIEQRVQQERISALQLLNQAHKTSKQLLDEITSIVKSTSATPNEKYYKIEKLIQDFECVQDDREKAILAQLDDQLTREAKNTTYNSALEALATRLQIRLSPVLMGLDFDYATSSPALLEAIQHFKSTDGKIGQNPPLGFLMSQQKDAIYRDSTLIEPLYKCLLFIKAARALKSGELNLLYSYRYRSVESYLIDKSEWEKNRKQILEQTGLSKFADGDAYLDILKSRLDDRYRIVNENFQRGQNPFLNIDPNGKVHVRTPRTDFENREIISAMLSREGVVPIIQVLRETDRMCQFTDTFKHHAVKNIKSNPSKQLILAGIIGKGCNIGVRKLANISTGLSENSLINTVNWYFDLKNIQAANRKLVEMINKLSLANNYIYTPGRLHSSSDGRKVGVAVDSLLSNYSFKYFGHEKGVSIYTFIDERQVLFYSTVISASDREAAFVIDGLMQNDVEESRIHSTDTHGFTETIFCATHFMDTAFAPRIKNIGHQTIYGFSAKKTYQKRGYDIVPSRTINQGLILKNWDDILRFMATIKSHHSTASQLFKRLSSYAIDHPLYRAMKEFGRIIKSQFVLTYYDDLELRQQIQKQLNRIEQSNKFSKAVFFDDDEDFKEGLKDDQEVAVACKVLIQNAIVLWNYLYLSDVLINTTDDDERVELIQSIGRGSVLTWRHVNLRGEYDFSKSASNDRYFDFEKILSFKIK